MPKKPNHLKTKRNWGKSENPKNRDKRKKSGMRTKNPQEYYREEKNTEIH